MKQTLDNGKIMTNNNDKTDKTDETGKTLGLFTQKHIGLVT